MTADTLEAYLQTLDWRVERLRGADSQLYIVVRDYQITAGSLSGRSCDVAVQWTGMVPYVPPPAIHTRPALVPMDMAGPLRTQQSGLGPEWQYWSRTVRAQSTPQLIVAHIATVLGEV